MNRQPVCVCVSDIHLRHTCPMARSNEPDWYVAMGRVLEQVRSIVQEHRCPLLCAGDVFHRWNSPPELVNFAIKNLPKMLAIPGQHDLPYHQVDASHKSAYGTLDLSNKLWGGSVNPVDLGRGDLVHKFPWGVEVVPWEGKKSGSSGLQIALIHAMVWKKGYDYPGAPPASNLDSWKDRLKGYDVAIFGDNHSEFTAKVGDCIVVNCGCLIPSRSIEKSYCPSVWVVFDDGSVKRIMLNIDGDQWIDNDGNSDGWFQGVDADGLIAEMVQAVKDVAVSSLSFRLELERYFEQSDKDDPIRSLVFKAMEACDG